MTSIKLYFERDYLEDGSFIYTDPLEKPEHGKSFVYFLQVGDKGPIKIGFSTCIEKRIKILQTASTQKLKLLCAVEGDRSIERMFHHRFRKTRILGEWFSPHAVLIYLAEQFPTAQPE